MAVPGPATDRAPQSTQAQLHSSLRQSWSSNELDISISAVTASSSWTYSESEEWSTKNLIAEHIQNQRNDQQK